MRCAGNMENKVTIDDAASYFLMLYGQTDYMYDKRKMQKLIIFTDLLYYTVNGKRLLSETDVTATDRGLSIDNLSNLYTLSFNYKNERKEIDEKIIKYDTSLELNSAYGFRAESIDAQIRELLNYTFCKFGAFSGDDLTYISRESMLWKNARKDSQNINHYVTVSLYRDFVQTVVKNEQNEKLRQDLIVQHLKGLLPSEQS